MTQPADTHIQAGDGHGHAAPPASPFTPADIDFFHKDDRTAGAAIVILISSIFVVGLVMYLIIAWIVS